MCTVPVYKYICQSNEYFFCKFLLEYELLGRFGTSSTCLPLDFVSKSANFEITQAVSSKKHYLNYNILQQKSNAKHQPIG